MDAIQLFFHTNIRLLRERKGLSQEVVARDLGISRNKLQALESGKTVNPTAVDMVQFSDYFKVSVDSLLKVELGKLSESGLMELFTGNDVYMTGSKIRVLVITVDKNDMEQVEYVPVKARAGYMAGYNDPEYIATLPKFSMPHLPRTGTFRMFPTMGDSMLPIPEGADILCSFIQNWAELKPKTLCIAVLKGAQDFVFKQVTLVAEGLLMESLNKSYQPYTVPVGAVLELWKFYSYQTREIPDAQSDLQSLARAVKDMQETLVEIKQGK